MNVNMQTSIDHLPEHKQAQLRAVTALILNNTASVEMVILFGSHARGDWVEDRATGYFSDFDLLVVVSNPAEATDSSLWRRLTAEGRRITGYSSVRFLPLHFKDVNREIRIGHYFFADVVIEGIWLYNSRSITLAKPKAKTPTERLALSEWDFTYWFESATGFWISAGYGMSVDMLCQAAFILHQAVERYYHAVLLVFVGHKPKCHDIEELADTAAPLHGALAGAMPRAEGEDERLFDLLKRAYIEARYSKTYRITIDELTVLREQVRDLAQRTRTACIDRLSTILGPEAVSEQLPMPPEPTDIDAFPPPPDRNDAEAVNVWMTALIEKCELRGRNAGLREGKARGRKEGLREGQQRLIAQLLEAKFGPLSAEMLAELQNGTQEALDTWAKRLLTAASLDEVFLG